MGWPGFLQRLLVSCFGERDESVDLKPISAGAKESAKRQEPSEPMMEASRDVPPHEDVVAESSATASERHQSEPSQSDTTQPTTQPTSLESSGKADLDPEAITIAKAAIPAPTNTEPDPDEITPVQPKPTMYSNVTQLLDDRRIMYDRLRRRSEVPTLSLDTQSGSQQTTPVVSKTEGKKPVAGQQSGS